MDNKEAPQTTYIDIPTGEEEGILLTIEQAQDVANGRLIIEDLSADQINDLKAMLAPMSVQKSLFTGELLVLAKVDAENEEDYTI